MTGSSSHIPYGPRISRTCPPQLPKLVRDSVKADELHFLSSCAAVVYFFLPLPPSGIAIPPTLAAAALCAMAICQVHRCGHEKLGGRPLERSGVVRRAVHREPHGGVRGRPRSRRRSMAPLRHGFSSAPGREVSVGLGLLVCVCVPARGSFSRGWFSGRMLSPLLQSLLRVASHPPNALYGLTAVSLSLSLSRFPIAGQPGMEWRCSSASSVRWTERPPRRDSPRLSLPQTRPTLSPPVLFLACNAGSGG